MNPFRKLLLASLLVPAAASAQTLTAQTGYHTFDADGAALEDHYESLQGTTGAVEVDHAETYLRRASTYTGAARASADYGVLKLYARTGLDEQVDAAYGNSTTAEGVFFDPLTIAGGAAGEDLVVTMTLDGDIGYGSLDGYGIGFGASATFYVYDEATDSWNYVMDQRYTFIDDVDGDPSTLDWRSSSVLMGYDPSLRYALSGYASISSDLRGGISGAAASNFVEVDATHTAKVAGIGFASGSTGTFTGASGFVYPSAAPVPEPAPLAAVGLGLLAVGRRRPRGC